MTRIIQNFSEISPNYHAVFCDLWGVLHNGREVFPDAAKALQEFRKQGGAVVLLTNAPRPRPGVIAQLDRLGVPRDAWDLVVSSGDASQNAIAAGLYGKKIYHVGPDRDLIFFDDHNGQPLPVERVGIDQAESIICTGLWDDQTETPDDYRALILDGVNRGLPMLCANPDLMVDHGQKRIYCGGAIGEAYSAAGGTTHYYGKPHAPIYELSQTLLTELTGKITELPRIIGIGDGILTDVPGASAAGIDCLFVSGGLALEDTGTKDGNPDPEMLKNFLWNAQLSPQFTIGHFR